MMRLCPTLVTIIIGNQKMFRQMLHFCLLILKEEWVMETPYKEQDRDEILSSSFLLISIVSDYYFCTVVKLEISKTVFPLGFVCLSMITHIIELLCRSRHPCILERCLTVCLWASHLP